MPAPRKYSDELRERAIRTVNETIRESPGMPVKRACHQVGEQLRRANAILRSASAFFAAELDRPSSR